MSRADREIVRLCGTFTAEGGHVDDDGYLAHDA